ncbi:MAG: dockerin type I repeat-containing protein [Clostridia bacterium]|nr:dockerin type I repeat-containing protein [Clostridia bacterium]
MDYYAGEAIISVVTPDEFKDSIEYYEYRENGGSWTLVLDKNFSITRSSDRTVDIRCTTDSGEMSSVLTLYIRIPKGNVFEDPVYGVSAEVPYDSSVIETDTLSVAEVASGAYYDAAKAKASVNSFILYDVRFTRGGDTVEPTTKVRWRIPLPDRYKGDVCLLYHITDEGDFSVLRYDPKGEDLIFDAPFAGYFLIIDVYYIDGVAPGDVDNDGSLTAADARFALRNAIGLSGLMHWQLDAADMDADGSVTAADARLILRASIGL